MKAADVRTAGALGLAALILGAGLAAAGGMARGGRSLESEAAERGRVALTTRSFIEPEYSLDAYAKARSLIGADAPDPESDPEGYARAFNRHFGLHPAPYPNDGLPMGLRRADSFDGARVGLNVDCLMCHGGSIGGTSYVGLGNTTLDMEAVFKDLAVVDGRRPPVTFFTLNSTRGTNNAGQVDAVLLSLRNADLSRRKVPLLLGARIPETDTPAWWLLKKKRTKYYDGRTEADAVRSNMQFMLGAFSLEQFRAEEPTFRDIDAYLRSLEPPRYPFPVDAAKAERGRRVFEKNCVSCHGTYGDDWTYPNEVVPLDIIGTDPDRAVGLTPRVVAHYNATWFGAEQKSEEEVVGYQAPPLDGIWATAPYLHNGSVPTLYHLLNSSARPDRFRRPPSTDLVHYDSERVGWKAEPWGEVDPARLSRHERKFLFDASRFGLSNRGHTFGDRLTEEQRTDLIEYLKTL